MVECLAEVMGQDLDVVVIGLQDIGDGRLERMNEGLHVWSSPEIDTGKVKEVQGKKEVFDTDTIVFLAKFSHDKGIGLGEEEGILLGPRFPGKVGSVLPAHGTIDPSLLHNPCLGTSQAHPMTTLQAHNFLTAHRVETNRALHCLSVWN